MRNRLHRLLFGCVLLLASCMAPDLPEQGLPLRDGYPLDELWIVHGLAETMGLVNCDRLFGGRSDYFANPLFLTGRVPNRIVVDGTNGIIVNSTGHSLTLFSLRSPGQRREIALPGGSNPWDAALLHREGLFRILVTAFMRNSLCVVDPVSGRVEHEIMLTNGSRPEGLAIVGTRAWVAMSGWNFSSGDYDPGRVSLVDISANDPRQWRETGWLAAGSNPQTIFGDTSGQVHVLSTGRYNTGAGVVRVFDAETLVLKKEIATGGSPQALAFDVTAGIMHAAGGAMHAAYDVATLETLALPEVEAAFRARDISALAIDTGRRILFAADFSGDQLLAIALDGTGLVRSLQVADGPVALAAGTTW